MSASVLLSFALSRFIGVGKHEFSLPIAVFFFP